MLLLLFKYHGVHNKDYLDAALKTALQIHKCTDDGDILVFLPGQDEIEDLASLLKTHLEELEPGDYPGAHRIASKDIVQNIKGIGTSVHSGSTMIVNGVLICVLYAALPPYAQMVAFRPKPEGCSRKIILSTNIAGEFVSFEIHGFVRAIPMRCINLKIEPLTSTKETSVTLDGIKYVVDCGKHKSREYSASTGMESLKLSNISKAQVRLNAIAHSVPTILLPTIPCYYFPGCSKNGKSRACL